MDRLAELRRQVERERQAAVRPSVARHRRRWWTWLAIPLGAVLLMLPIVALLRGATFFYLHLAWPTWVAIGAAAAVAAGLVTTYAALVSRRLTGRSRIRFVAQWIATPLVLAYAIHALLFVSRVNTKTESVRSYYRALHPTLRLAVSTFVILDDGLVVTDIQRTPEDYAMMGLPAYDASLHFRQNDGYVHAMDLRTIGRGAVRNWVTAMYFRVLGFRTLRHVGTADHLHVSFPRR